MNSRQDMKRADPGNALQFPAIDLRRNDEMPSKCDALLTNSDKIGPKMTKQFVITDESVTKFHEGNDEIDTPNTKPITKYLPGPRTCQRADLEVSGPGGGSLAQQAEPLAWKA